MRHPKSLIRIIHFSMAFFAVALTVSVGLFWISDTVKDAEKQNGEIRERYLNEQKGVIKSEVDHVLAYIQQKKSLTQKRLKATIKSRTEEAYQTALYIYEQNRDSKPIAEIKKMVHDALFSASWDQGRGYYFAVDMAGTGMINRNKSEQEGQNLIDLQDDQGTFFIQDFLAKARTEEREGFCSYNWVKPEEPTRFTRKISYVKYFPPFDWVLGNGMYIVDEEKAIQQEILARVESIRYGDEGYVFIGQWDGLALSGPAEGKNMIGITDVNGVKIVEELIARAKDGGGFLSYVMPAIEGKPQAPKISYAAPVEDWQWYVGTGVYVDAIEHIILARQKELRRSVQTFVLQSVLMLFLFLLLSLALSLFLSRRIKGNLHAFSDFFNQSVVNALPIVEDRIAFMEFHSMAVAANRMAEERRKAWLALEESEQRFHQVIDAAHIPLVITDRDNRIRHLNRKFVELFGYSQELLPDLEHWWECACPDRQLRAQLSREWELAMIAAEKSDKPQKEFTVQVCCADGTLRTIEMESSVVGAWKLISLQDLTAQIQADEEKKSLEAKLSQAQKMEAIGLLAGGVAHDLNNILSGIVSYPELLLMQLPEDSKLRKSIHAIHESGKRAAAVVADLLTIARGIVATREVICLNSLISDFLNSPECLRIRTLHPAVKIVTSLDPALLSISCSPIHIRKVLLNLVLNAAEAINGAGAVVVETTNQYVDSFVARNQYLQMGEYVLLRIKDSGPGIPEKDLERIFEPFYTKKVMGKSGTGLGLTVVWNTVQEHGGAVTVESTGEGTCFTLYLPATREKIEELPPIDDISVLRGRGQRILVVDDEALQRDISSNYLSYLGYQVDTVESGEKAVEYLQTRSVDLLLLDMIMDPGINGRETYEQILRIHPDQKAVIASGFSETEEVEKALSLGISRLIKKPYTYQQIAAVIYQALHE